jgi:hypothetical protein
MKITGLMQLMGAAPELFDKKTVITDALQTIGWNNPEQFFSKLAANNPMAMLSNPMVLKGIAELLLKKQDSDSKKMVAEAQAADLHAKALETPNSSAPDSQGTQIKAAQAQAEIQLKQAQANEINAKTQMGQGQNPTQMADLQLRHQEITQKQQESSLDAINRKRDRESRERLAAVKLAESIAANPQAASIVGSILDPNMIKRLESNEAELMPNSKGIPE